MQKTILNFRVIIEPEKMGKKTVYNAYCPTLGIADYGDSIEEVLESIQDGIKLAEQFTPKPIPQDTLKAILRQAEISEKELIKVL